MNNIKNTIGWADYSWNPIVGCRKGCYYCYAKAMNDRFKFIPDFSKPQFFPERLLEPAKLKKPSKIFVCSMGEIFDGEPDDVMKIIRVAKDNPQHTFMFLTQHPNRYRLFYFPDNCMLGVTITKDTALNSAQYDWLTCGNLNNKKFISIEPIMGDFSGFIFDGIDLVIIGAMTGPKAKPTQKEWIESVKHHNIFYKESAKRFLQI
ncbi:MAG: phage Gp37/Gp68 family protein [Bacteroidetes bacterium]|nr:phage Gp37/Gp68 family protein [Bacteroidota bacterium]